MTSDNEFVSQLPLSQGVVAEELPLSLALNVASEKMHNLAGYTCPVGSVVILTQRGDLCADGAQKLLGLILLQRLNVKHSGFALMPRQEEDFILEFVDIFRKPSSPW